jgi:hypothetical protein
MADKNSKKKTKHLSKGQRTHVRRLKQAAGKEVGANSPSSASAKRVRASKKQDGS